MTMSHDPSHEKILERAEIGDLATDAPSFRALLEGCERCAADWKGLEETREALESAAVAEHADHAMARSTRGAPGEDLVVADVERLASRSRNRSLRAASIILTAAAVWIVIVLGQRRADVDHGDSPITDIRMGGSIELQSPIGEIESLTRFEWTGRLDPGGAYEVTVRTADEDVASPTVRSGRLRESRWIPSDSEREAITALGTVLRWDVAGFDVNGQPVANSSTTRIVLVSRK